jgi:hypothetical protein
VQKRLSAEAFVRRDFDAMMRVIYELVS